MQRMSGEIRRTATRETWKTLARQPHFFGFFSFFSSKINTLIAKKGFKQLQKPILLVAVLPQCPFPLNSSSPYGILQDEQIPQEPRPLH